MMRFADFLADVPPGVEKPIEDLFTKREPPYLNAPNWKVGDPEITIYCDNDGCKGVRYFETISAPEVEFKKYSKSVDIYLDYWCRNCGRNKKTFALRITQKDPSSLDGVAKKFGEMPAFGPPIPSKVISLVGPDRETFLSGRRAESQGLGIGAFAYYRRVVENQKGRLIGEIVRVAKRLGTSSEMLSVLERAAEETQFSKAVGDIKSAIPQALFIDGHNPFTLLHDALSKGLHAKTDEDCLKMAASIRVVLTELSERISLALKDEAELKQAMKNLMRPSDL